MGPLHGSPTQMPSGHGKKKGILFWLNFRDISSKKRKQGHHWATGVFRVSPPTWAKVSLLFNHSSFQRPAICPPVSDRFSHPDPWKASESHLRLISGLVRRKSYGNPSEKPAARITINFHPRAIEHQKPKNPLNSPPKNNPKKPIEHQKAKQDLN